MAELSFIASEENGRLWRFGRVAILETNGDAKSRGRQHGRLLSEAVRNGAVPILATRADQPPEEFAQDDESAAIFRTHVEHIYAAIRDELPQPMLQEIAGLAEGSQVSEDALLRASFLSEALQLLVGGPSLKSRSVANGGCTAAVVTGHRSGHGSLHAKNQDYDGVGSWDRYPLLHIARPDDGLAFASATTAGLLKGNLTINAAGLTVGGHFLFSSAPGSGSYGLTALERRIALEARTVEEAIAIIQAVTIMGAFALVLTDHQGSACAVECDGAGTRVRNAEGDALGMSNLFCTADGREHDLLPAWSMHRNPMVRQARVDALLQQLEGPVDAERLANILGDRYDLASKAERGAAHVISQPTTVTSAVADSGSMVLWIGSDPAPVANGSFFGLALTDAFEGKGARIVGEFNTIKDPSQKASVAGLRAFIAAGQAYRAGLTGTALSALAEAASIEPEETAYYRFAAQVRVARLADSATELDAAAKDCVRANACRQSYNEAAEVALLSGYIADLQGQREVARTHYAHVLEIAREAEASANPWDFVNQRLVDATLRALNEPFTHDAACRLRVAFDLFGGHE